MGDATHSGSKIDMVCRIAAADATAAGVIETAVRADETYAIAAAAATKTATVRGRVLADVESSTDASQVQSDVLETVDEVKDGIDSGGEMADVAGNSATSVPLPLHLCCLPLLRSSSPLLAFNVLVSHLALSLSLSLSLSHSPWASWCLCC